MSPLSSTRLMFISVALLLAACLPAHSPTPIPVSTPTVTAVPHSCQVGMWARQTPYHWEHDCEPYTSEHFIVYSDGARLEDKVRFAEEAEKSYAYILTTLLIKADELRFPAGHEQIEIFASTRHLHEFGGGFAYYVGFLFNYDSGSYRMTATRWPQVFQFAPLFTHEITHTVAFLLSGYGSRDSLLVSTWFDEGLAVYVSRDDPYYISSLAQWDTLRQSLAAVPGQGNPLLINLWEDIPGEYFTQELMDKLYALFELAVRYLVDSYGIEKCKQVYIDSRLGISFEQSFANQFGFSLQEYQDTFFNLMQAYLP